MHHLSHSFSGALRTFTYFMASGTQFTLEGVNYLELYGNDPSAIEQVYAIFVSTLLSHLAPEVVADNDRVH